MKIRFLKGMVLGLLGFLLMVSLLILGLALTVNSTLLNPNFVKQEVKQIDVQSVAEDVLKNNLPSDAQPYLKDIGGLISDIKPWLYQQTDYLIDSGYRYLKDSASELNLVIETDGVIPVLVNWVTKTYLNTLTADQINAIGVNQISITIKQEVDNILPSSIKINADTLGSETMRVLAEVRQAIKIWYTSFSWVCFLTALWIILIVLVMRKVKDILQTVGIIFLIQGVLDFAIYFVLINLPKYLPFEGVSESIRTWIVQLLHDLVTPWWIYSIIMLIIGLGILLTSFFIKYPYLKKNNSSFVH